MKLVTDKLYPDPPDDIDDDDYLRIYIRRDFLLKDAIREGKKKKFTTHKRIKVS